MVPPIKFRVKQGFEQRSKIETLPVSPTLDKKGFLLLFLILGLKATLAQL